LGARNGTPQRSYYPALVLFSLPAQNENELFDFGLLIFDFQYSKGRSKAPIKNRKSKIKNEFGGRY